MNPHNVRIFVYTEREGMLSPVGHDLKLVVNRLEIDEDPGGFSVHIDAESIKVAACIVDGKEGTVSTMDRTVIEKNMHKDVLRTKQFKHIDFDGTVDESGDTRTITGRLKLLGKERDVTFTMQRDGDTWRGEVVVDQRDFGIKPYTAFLGALRIKPDIRIEVLADA